MEFGNYFSGSFVESSALTAFWPYPATGTSGNFSLNSPITGTFPITQIIQQSVSILDEVDFTLFMTISTGVVAAPPEFQFRTQVLASTASVSNTGWDFGILASNSFFISSPSGEIYAFNEIHLGTKNCFCLQKSGQSFTVYKYDIYSRAIESEQTIFFNAGTNLDSGGTIYIGYNANSDIGAYHYSWYGLVDQLALINEPLDRSIIRSLFSGFEPRTFNISTSYSDYLLSSVWRPSDIHSNYTGLTYPLIQNTRQYVFSLPSGNYVSSFSGNVGSTFSGSGYFVSGVDLCYGSGTGNLFSYNSTSGASLGSGWVVTDFIRSNAYLAGPTGSQTQEVLITHNFNISYNSTGIIKFSYDELYQKNRPTYSTGETFDSGYFSGFYMDGVSQNNYYNNSIVLGAITGAVPTGVNILGKFDQVSGLFTVLEQSGYYYYNGITVPSSGFVKNADYIDMVSVTETDSDYLIYDLYSGLNLMFYGLQGYGTGRYFPRTATPYTGENSYSVFQRNLPSNYHETSKLHMFHSQPVLYQSDANQFNNLEDYWQ